MCKLPIFKVVRGMLGVGVRVRFPYSFLLLFFSMVVKFVFKNNGEWKVLFLGCFHKNREFSMNWKNTVQEGFPRSIKIAFTF